MTSPAPARVAEVDVSRIAANVERLRRDVGTPHFLAVVKANAYGHGAQAVARAALEGGADWLGVVDLVEAVALRVAGVDAPLLTWLHDADADFGVALERGIDVGVSSGEQLLRVADTAPGAAVQVKVETGLSRNGLEPERWAEVFALAARLQAAGRIRFRGVFTHLSNASPAADAVAAARFADAVAAARAAGLDPEYIHLAATGAALAYDQGAATMVRCGIGIYGLSPYDDGDSARLGLSPAMTLRSRVAAVRRVDAGAGVSYDYVWQADRATTLALVPLGYADGIPRAASNRAEVWLGGALRPVRGRIAMDQFVVDVGDDAVAVGDRVVVFGDPATGVPSAADWARWSGTISYEIVTRLGNRVERVAVGG